MYLQKNLCLIGSNINFMSIQGKTTNITHKIWFKTTLEFLIETANRPPEPWTTQKFQLNPSYTDFLNVVQTKKVLTIRKKSSLMADNLDIIFINLLWSLYSWKHFKTKIYSKSIIWWVSMDVLFTNLIWI